MAVKHSSQNLCGIEQKPKQRTVIQFQINFGKQPNKYLYIEYLSSIVQFQIFFLIYHNSNL